MRPTIPFFLALALALAGAALTRPALGAAADDTCAGFSWNVSRERALFGGSASAMPAGGDSGSAPSLTPDRLYALQLQPAAEVSFVTAPGNRHPIEGGYAGLVSVRIPAPGTYRIAVDAPFWIDVVADGGLMNAKDFQGAHDCNAPRKILEYDFAVPRQVILQISGATAASVRIGITVAGT